MPWKGTKWDTKREVKYALFLLLVGWCIIIPAVIVTPQYAINPFLFGFIFITIWSVFYIGKKLHSLKTSQKASPELITSPITAKCPYCDSAFPIIFTIPTPKPIKVKCPQCGKKSMLK